jgi:hypothetical protein
MRIPERHEFLGDYVRRAAKGEFGVAGFQRPFRWNKRDVEAFLGSVMDEIPIGSFLTWRLTSEQRAAGRLSKGRIGPVVHDPSAEILVLDGQNRLSTIVWAARRPEAPLDPECRYSAEEIEVWLGDEVLVADVEERRMHFVPSVAAKSSKRYPLGEVMAAAHLGIARPLDLLSGMEAAGISDGDFNWFFDELPHFFRAKKTVVAEICDATAEEAFDVFLRICKTGVAISDEDVEEARKWMIPAEASGS